MHTVNFYHLVMTVPSGRLLMGMELNTVTLIGIQKSIPTSSLYPFFSSRKLYQKFKRSKQQTHSYNPYEKIHCK